MKAFFLFLLGIFVWMNASAQKVYFIYLQTDNQSPFYVKMGDKVISSSSGGYVILSNLVDSTYQFAVGFPGSREESRFRVSNNGSDRGFVIKNLQGSIQLFDLQSASLQKSLSEASTSGGTAFRVKDDAFTRLLARAMNDSSLLLVEVPAEVLVQSKPKEKKPEIKEPLNTEGAKPVVLVETRKPDEPKGEEKKSEPSENDVAILPAEAKKTEVGKIKEEVREEAKKEEPKKEEVKTDAIAKNPPPAKQEGEQEGVNPQPKAVMEAREKEVVKNDAVRPAEHKTEEPRSELKEERYKASVVTKRSESSTTEGFGLVYLDEKDGVVDTIRILIPPARLSFRTEAQQETPRENKVFLDLTNIDSSVQEKAVVREVPVRKPCTVTASDNDFLKLRRNMASEESEDGMLAEARKAWKNKCFTTDHIRNLSALFLTSYGKFQFFESAYLHVSDSEQYESLRSELKDDYYIKRFNALIGK